MSEIINLRSVRKARCRADAAAQADMNRARHGLTKAERLTLKGEAERAARNLAGAKREPDK